MFLGSELCLEMRVGRESTAEGRVPSRRCSRGQQDSLCAEFPGILPAGICGSQRAAGRAEGSAGREGLGALLSIPLPRSIRPLSAAAAPRHRLRACPGTRATAGSGPVATPRCRSHAGTLARERVSKPRRWSRCRVPHPSAIPVREAEGHVTG